MVDPDHTKHSVKRHTQMFELNLDTVKICESVQRSFDPPLFDSLHSYFDERETVSSSFEH